MDDALLCFGGTFNPIHRAHERCAKAAMEAAGFRSVTLIPTGDPPHKRTAVDLASATDRLAMVRLLAETDPALAVSDIEITTPGPHYTLHTARALTARTGRRVCWLIGADQLLRLPTWHRWETLLDEVDFFVMRRPGYAIDWAALPAPLRALAPNVVDIPEIDISATNVRRRVAAGEPIDYLVSPAVAAYIRERGLYKKKA